MYDSLADDFCVNVILNTEMPLPSTRETVLDFCGRVQKSFPQMRNFYTRETGEFVLEEDKDQPNYRWMSLEQRRICSGVVNPPSIEESIGQHQLILELAPYMLSVSPLDCEALDFVLGFDFLYRGNHDQIVAQALGVGSALESLVSIPGARPLNFEPNITLALDESCRRQCRIMIETRTNAYQVRRNEYVDEMISVYFTVRQYGSLPHDSTYVDMMNELRRDAERLLNEHVVDQILRPLAQAIEQG